MKYFKNNISVMQASILVILEKKCAKNRVDIVQILTATYSGSIIGGALHKMNVEPLIQAIIKTVM